MPDIESTAKHPKGSLPEDVFDRLTATTGKYIVRADNLGIHLGAVYQNGYAYSQTPDKLELVELGHRTEVFAASHAKLAVAAYRLERLGDENLVAQLSRIEALLGRSDNDAFNELIGDDAEAIVAHARTEAGISTDILTIRENGTAISGMTTAVDSMRLMVYLLRTAKHHHLRDEVSRMLATNNSRYGVRTALSAKDIGVTVMNKTADYYGEDDPEVGEDVHHDVGVVFAKKTAKHKTLRMAFSLTTSSPDKKRAVIANEMIRQLGAEYVTAVGGAPKRLMGSRALVLAAQTPLFP